MRPLVSCSTFLAVFSVVAFVAAGRQEIIDNQDSRIYYSDGWISKKIPGGDGRTWSLNDKASGTASLKVYNASRIAVYVFVEGAGQTVRISLDNQYHDLAPLLSQQPAWTSDLLDPSVPRDLQIIKQNAAGQYIGIDSVQVTYPNPANSTDPAVTAPTPPDKTENPTKQPDVQPSSYMTSTVQITAITPTGPEKLAETENPTKQPDVQSGLTVSTKVGIAAAIVAVCLVLLGALGIYLWRNGRKHDGTLIPFGEADTSPFQSSGAPDTGTRGVSPFVGKGGVEAPQSLQSSPPEVVETQPDRVREDGGLNKGSTRPTPEGQTDVDGDGPTLPLREAENPQLPPGPPADRSSAPPPYSP